MYYIVAYFQISSTSFKMKTLQAVVFFAILGVALSTKFTEDMLTDSDRECIKNVGVDVQTVLNSVNDVYITTESDPKINAYTECWYRKENCIDENNEIKFDVTKTLFASFIEFIDNQVENKDQIANDAVDACKSVAGENLGDRLVKFGNCVLRQIQKN